MRKNIMKKAAITLAGSMVLSMAACGSKTEQQRRKRSTEAAADGKGCNLDYGSSVYGTELKNDHSDEVCKV